MQGLLRVFVALLALGGLGAVADVASAADALIQQISSDPFSNSDSQHATEVEPDSFAHENMVVTAFQVGRYVLSGGASSIGFATSTNGGNTWSHGILPSLTVHSTPAGPYTRASDPTVAYDAEHGTWLISSLTLTAPCTPDCRTALVVSRSSDGLTWSAPVAVAPLASTFAHDKNWTVCDNGPSSPHRGTCYTSYSDFTAGRRIVTSRSTNGGLTWSTPAVGSPSVGATGLGAQPVVQPSGTLIVVFLAGDAENQIAAIRSTDGGLTFSAMTVVSSSTRHKPTSMRGRALPSVEIDANGVVYAAWDDCRFRPDCSPTTGANDIVLATSNDGIAWSTPSRVPIDDVSSGIDHFIPGLAVDAGTSGADTRLALTYYYFPVAGCTFAACELRVGFVSSNNAGATWSAPIELSGGPMSLSWIPDTSQGRMVGDYISTSFVSGGAAVAVFPLGRAPSSGFDLATFAARVAVAPPPPPPPPVPTPSPVQPSPTAPTPDPAVTPSPPRGSAAPTRLAVFALRAIPSRPAAGRMFTVRFRVRLGAAGSPLPSGTALCSARVGSTILRTATRTFRNGFVTCAWRIPSGTSGKTIRTTVGASRASRIVRAVRSFRVA